MRPSSSTCSCGRAGCRRTWRTTPRSAGSRPSTPRRRPRAPPRCSASLMSRPSVSSDSGVGTWPIGVSTAAALPSMRSMAHLRTRLFSPKPGPQEAAVVVAAEPVDVEDLRQLGGVGVLAEVDPVLEVVAGVVADERQHGHRVAAHDADRAGGGGGRLRGERRAHERAVHPVARLGHQRDGRLAAAAEEDRRDRHALGVVVLVGEDRALLDRGAVAAVRRGWTSSSRVGRPVLALPAGGVGRACSPCPPTRCRRRRSARRW